MRFTALAACFVFALTTLGAAGAYGEPGDNAPGGDASHPSIAVLPLQGSVSGGFGNPSDQVYQKVSQAFFKTKRFHLIERSQIGAVLGEGKFQSSGLVDDATAVTLGKQIGAKFVILGSYNGSMSRSFGEYRDKKGYLHQSESFPAALNLTIRMVSVENGRIEDTFEAKGTARAANPSKALDEVMSDLSTKLEREVANHYPLTGYLISVTDENEGLIDLGKKDGVREGDEVSVFVRGANIVHPVTGKVIKGAKKMVTEFKVISVDEETAVVKRIGDNVVLKPGMALESKPRKRGFLESLNDTLLK